MEYVKEFAGYLAVEISHIVPDTLVNFNIFLERNNSLLLYKPAHEVITEENIERMLRLGSEVLYVEAKDKKELLDYYQNNIDTLVRVRTIPTPGKGRLLHQVARHVLEKSFQKPELRENFQHWEKSIRSSFHFIIEHPGVFESMVLVAEKDSYTYTHSVNVGLLMIGFALYNGIKEEKSIMEIGLGGLLHDLGKASVSESILKKPSSLSLDEWVVIRRHPEEGVRLADIHDHISERSKIIILQHHEAVNGTGYPRKLVGGQIDFLSRAARIIDAFDSMTSNRPYRGAITPYEAMKNLVALEGFDRSILKNFIQFLSMEHMPKGAERISAEKSVVL